MTYYVKAQHTNRPPTRVYTGAELGEERKSADYQRVTLAWARQWSKLPHTPANDWRIKAAKAVLEYAN